MTSTEAITYIKWYAEFCNIGELTSAVNALLSENEAQRMEIERLKDSVFRAKILDNIRQQAIEEAAEVAFNYDNEMACGLTMRAIATAIRALKEKPLPFPEAVRSLCG
jgi:hypothetical protein